MVLTLECKAPSNYSIPHRSDTFQAELAAWPQEPRWCGPQTTRLSLTMGLPAGQMLPDRIHAQAAVELPDSLVWKEPRHAVS